MYKNKEVIINFSNDMLTLIKKHNSFLNWSFLTAIILAPVVSFAANGDSIGSIAIYFNDILIALAGLFVGFAIFLFLYGILKYVGSGDNEEKRQEGRGVMIYGIIIIFVMVSIWGIVNLLDMSLYLDNDVPYEPNVPTQN